MITCRNISYKNVKAKYRVKFQSTQVWKDSQIFWNLSVRLLSHRCWHWGDEKTIGKLVSTVNLGQKIIPCGKTFSLWLSFVYSICSLRCDGGWTDAFLSLSQLVTKKLLYGRDTLGLGVCPSLKTVLAKTNNT